MNTDMQDEVSFEALLEYIRGDRGFDFTGYKRASLQRRIAKRMRMVQIETYQEYLDYLQVQPDEFVQLFNTILINVTRFFRDPDAWSSLNEQVVSRIVDGSTSDQPIRVWNPGCASGQDACTIAILLAEAIGMDAFRDRVKIYGTDVDEHALFEARSSVYTSTALESVPDEYRANYFTQQDDGQYAFNKELRRSIIFGRHDLVQDAPISKIDLLICRNTLMYFNAETQMSVLQSFHFALQEEGALFLGKGETLLSNSTLFAPTDLRQRLFQKKDQRNARPRAQFRKSSAGQNGDASLSPIQTLRELAFDSSPVAQLVLDADGALVIANSHARNLFGIRDNQLGQPFQDFPISYDPTDLRTSINEARDQRRAITREDVRWNFAGESRHLHIEVIPLIDSGDVSGVSLTFSDTSRKKHLQVELEHARQDLETANEELESTIEEVETTNEELQSTNEELETMNEELQSTNEELETMNEELQSTNEELEAINGESRSRAAQVNDANAFLESILRSLRVGVVVIDTEFHVQAWNSKATDMWGLRASEVIGGHFLNLDIGLPVEQLSGPIRDCLHQDVEIVQTTIAATNRTGKHITCKVDCMPLANNDSQLRGVIMLMEAVPIQPD